MSKKNKDNWRLHDICKTCVYRETAANCVNVANDWSNTCCTYAIVNDDFVDRTKVTDKYCPCYRRAENKAKKYHLDEES